MDRESIEQAGDRASEHPLSSAPMVLPEEITSFIGRSVELDRVEDLLGETRLLTLAGMGGCGKSRLALRSATRACGRFVDGVWWVELAALQDAELLITTVTGVLGLRERPGQAPIDTLGIHLAERHLLLVLDNCEHLRQACAVLVEALLSSCPSLAVLITSREALGLADELTFSVPPLSLPADSETVRAVKGSDAGRLFVERASHARASFVVTEQNAPAIATICRNLDGMPLAIELAAARVRMLSPKRIATELDDRLRLLTGAGRTEALRHETLRASIDWSYELCDEQERRLLRRLSVWAGGWELEAAEAVCADETSDGGSILGPLAGLVDKHLVDTEERDGEIRFRMLESIRQYAAERLTEAGELGATRARHLTWCLELAERAEPELVRHDASAWLGRLELEAANLRTALDRANADDGESALRLAAALTVFWLMRGSLVEGTAALGRVLDTAAQPSATRGKVLWGLAELSIWAGRFEASMKYAQQALADGEAVGDRAVMARALKAHGLVLNLPNHLRRDLLERSISLAREAGDEWCTAEATRFLAASYVRQGEHDEARPILEDGYSLACVLGHRPLYAWYFNLRAWGELEHGRVRAARDLAQQGCSTASQIGDPITLGMATALLVECDVLEGQPARARERAVPCVELMRSAGVRSAEVWIENSIVLADVAEGATDAARARIDAVLGLIETMPTYDTLSKARRRLAVTLLLLAEFDAAEAEAQAALSQAQTGRHEHLEAIACHLLGRVALARGALPDAEQRFHEALAIAIRRDFLLQTINSLEALGQVAAQTGSPIEATRLLAAAHAARKHAGVVRWPPEQKLWADVDTGLLTTLGQAAYANARAEGLALSLDEAVGYARRARGKRKRPSRGWESLTPTELEIVRHAAAGLTNPQIGERMFISRGTAKVHLSHVFAKLNVSSRSELAAEATRRGIAGDQGTTNPSPGLESPRF